MADEQGIELIAPVELAEPDFEEAEPGEDMVEDELPEEAPELAVAGTGSVAEAGTGSMEAAEAGSVEAAAEAGTGSVEPAAEASLPQRLPVLTQAA